MEIQIQIQINANGQLLAVLDLLVCFFGDLCFQFRIISVISALSAPKKWA